jgi:hypothetical protein
MDEESRARIVEQRSRPIVEESSAAVGEESRPLAAISDDDLLHRLAEILRQSRRVEKDLVAHIAEADERRLYAREAFPSMFAYCTGALHLSEAEAYLRIAVARASREHPMILAMLGDGRLHLSGIVVLAPHLTAENREALLRRATHRSKRQIEELIAELRPREDVPALMRRLPERRGPCVAAPATPSGMGNIVTSCAEPSSDGATERAPCLVPVATLPEPARIPTTPDRAPVSISPEVSLSQEAAHPLPPPVVEPLAPGRYKVQFTASAELHEKLERLRALMRSQIPDGDLGAVIEAAVSETLERLEARRFAATSRPRQSRSQADTAPASRHVPAAVRRAVRERDGDRCVYVDSSGRRCEERHRLEYHHRRPFAMGGDHRVGGISLVCRTHNLYLAEHDYGRGAMARFRRSIQGGAGGDRQDVAFARRSATSTYTNDPSVLLSRSVGPPYLEPRRRR